MFVHERSRENLNYFVILVVPHYQGRLRRKIGEQGDATVPDIEALPNPEAFDKIVKEQSRIITEQVRRYAEKETRITL